MTELVFVDTGVFLYAVDTADPRKHQVARTWRDLLWRQRRGRTSFQVLQEFYVQACRKTRTASARELARDEVRDLMSWSPVAPDSVVLERAWSFQDRYQLAFWDAAIVATASAAKCQYLLTEDLQHGQLLDGLRVVNPFRTEPGSF